MTLSAVRLTGSCPSGAFPRVHNILGRPSPRPILILRLMPSHTDYEALPLAERSPSTQSLSSRRYVCLVPRTRLSRAVLGWPRFPL